MVDTKTCSRCSTQKDANLFIKNRNICKECSNESKKKSKAKQKCIDPETMVQCTKCTETKKYILFIKGTKICKECENKRRKAKYNEKKANININQKKTCTLCKTEKTEADFNAGFTRCKECEAIKKETRLKNHLETQPKEKTCKDCGITQQSDQFRLGENVCYACSKLKLYVWRKDNSEKFHDICKKYREKDDYREKQNKSKKERYHNNPIERTGLNYRCHLRNYIFRHQVSKNIDKMVGLSPEQMKEWLEHNFKPGMNWENYGTFWNLDHVMPCSSYNLENKTELYECFSWKNTLPVYCKENLVKFDKVDENLKTYMDVRAAFFQDAKLQYHMKKVKAKKENSYSMDEEEVDKYFNNLEDEEEEKEENSITFIKKIKFNKKLLNTIK
jgi:hypothetical protein